MGRPIIILTLICGLFAALAATGFADEKKPTIKKSADGSSDATFPNGNSIHTGPHKEGEQGKVTVKLKNGYTIDFDGKGGMTVVTPAGHQIAKDKKGNLTVTPKDADPKKLPALTKEESKKDDDKVTTITNSKGKPLITITQSPPSKLVKVTGVTYPATSTLKLPDGTILKLWPASAIFGDDELTVEDDGQIYEYPKGGKPSLKQYADGTMIKGPNNEKIEPEPAETPEKKTTKEEKTEPKDKPKEQGPEPKKRTVEKTATGAGAAAAMTANHGKPIPTPTPKPKGKRTSPAESSTQTAAHDAAQDASRTATRNASSSAAAQAAAAASKEASQMASKEASKEASKKASKEAAHPPPTMTHSHYP